MIKLIIFDLDGVLIDAKPHHFKALNEALGPEYALTDEEHYRHYDGLPTRKKLEKLTAEKGLPDADHIKIENKKQAIFYNEYLSKIQPNQRFIDLFTILKDRGLNLAVATNAVFSTAYGAVENLGLLKFNLGIVGNNCHDIPPKPSPAIYLQMMTDYGIGPDETLIVEDSPVGLKAAYRSGAHVLRVDDPESVTLEAIDTAIKESGEKRIIWHDKKMNVVVPMGGSGMRFQEKGYKTPKPLIPIHGRPMIQWAVESLGINANFIFLIRNGDAFEHNLHKVLQAVVPGCTFITIPEATEGAACTTLWADYLFANDDPLVIMNSDQYVEYDSTEFIYYCSHADGGILTFKDDNPKWSYAAVKDGFVTEVAEKKVISDHATVGIYYWKRGRDYFDYAHRMIEKNIRVNNEFYVCPVYNQAIQDGKKIRVFPVEKMYGLGTPEDLEKNEKFLIYNNNQKKYNQE